MKFLITKAFLAALALGQSLAVEKMYGARFGSDNEEDAPFWSGFLVQGVDSMAEPTNKPSVKPIGTTLEPTDRPSIESNIHTPIPVDPTPGSVIPGTSAPSALITVATSVSSSCKSIGMCQNSCEPVGSLLWKARISQSCLKTFVWHNFRENDLLCA